MYMHEIKAVSHALDVSWDDEAIINAARKFTIKDYTKVIGTNVVVEFKDEILKFGANEVTQSANTQSANTQSATRNYVSANEVTQSANTQSATRNYVSANEVTQSANDNVVITIDI